MKNWIDTNKGTMSECLFDRFNWSSDRGTIACIWSRTNLRILNKLCTFSPWFFSLRRVVPSLARSLAVVVGMFVFVYLLSNIYNLFFFTIGSWNRDEKSARNAMRLCHILIWSARYARSSLHIHDKWSCCEQFVIVSLHSSFCHSLFLIRLLLIW